LLSQVDIPILPFLHSSLLCPTHKSLSVFQRDGNPLNSTLRVGKNLDSMHISLGPLESAPRTDLDQFCHFCIAHIYAQNRDAHTYTHVHHFAATGCIYALHAGVAA